MTEWLKYIHMMVRVRDRWRSKPEPWNPRWVWNMWEHQSWGKSIQWADFDKRRIYGHYDMVCFTTASPKRPGRLRAGDELRARMESGKVARFKIVELEYKNDPPDRFFGTVEDIGYLEDA
jgi:hypothetical protein